MKLAALILALAFPLGPLTAPLKAEGQGVGKVHRVAVVLASSPVSVMAGPDPIHPMARAFVHGLRDLGYIEGQNIIIERRSAEGNWEQVPTLFEELVRLRVDVIVLASNRLSFAAKKATKSIPIVMGTCSEPVAHGLVASLARPGGNITGFDAADTVDLVAKKFQILKEAAPKTLRVAVLTRPKLALSRDDLESAGQAVGVTPVVFYADSEERLEEAFGAMTHDAPDALLLDNVAFYWPHMPRIAEFATRNRLPSMGSWREFAKAGALMSYGANLPDLFRRAASYVDRILKGASPSDLPVQRPMKFDFVINLKTAETLGLTIPQPLLILATEVIE